MNEREFQAAVVKALRIAGYKVVVTHDARHRPVEPGIPDLIVLGRNRTGTWVEIKGDGGKRSADQIAFQAELVRYGHTVHNWQTPEDVWLTTGIRIAGSASGKRPTTKGGPSSTASSVAASAQGGKGSKPKTRPGGAPSSAAKTRSRSKPRG